MAQIMKSVMVVLGLAVGLSSGGALIAQTAAPQAPAATDVASNVLFAEKAKWGILRMHLTDKLSVAQTVVNQVGAVINNHAALCAFATAVAGSLAMFALTGSDESVRRSSPESGSSSSCAPCSNGKRGACSTFLTFAILEALTYGLCTVCGARWEDKSAQSLIALTDFVQGWSVYKEYTPVILHPLFQGYANDLKRHAQLTIIDGDGARKLIEALLATAVVVEAAK